MSTFERPRIFRPPSEWMSYYLPLTSGCSNNTCVFCYYYGSRLQMRDIEEVKEEKRETKYRQYMVWSASPGAATSKAIKQFCDDFKSGYDLRLGQGSLFVDIKRTHKKEADKWKGKILR